MSTAERLAARYTLACCHLDVDEWAPGMRRLRWAPGAPHHLAAIARVPDGPDMHDYDREYVVPDFDDNAVIGRLYALVIKVYAAAEEVALITRTGRRPAVRITTSGAISYSHGETIAEALILALEAGAAERIRNRLRGVQ
jgi:hypothetical protein